MITAIIIALFLVSSCKKDDTSNPDNPTNGFYPLKVGVEWTYSYNDNSSFTVKITGTQNIYGQEWWVVKDSDNEIYTVYRETDDAVFEDIGNYTDESATEKILTKAANIGDEWSSILQPGFTKTFKLLSKETLTINGSDYKDCFKILCSWTHDTDSGYYLQWQCSGYGLVKNSESDANGNVTNEGYTYFLTDFKE